MLVWTAKAKTPGHFFNGTPALSGSYLLLPLPLEEGLVGLVATLTFLARDVVGGPLDLELRPKTASTGSFGKPAISAITLHSKGALNFDATLRIMSRVSVFQRHVK